MSKQIIDLENWNRREHFEHFKSYAVPFWSVCANIDCTAAFRFAKENRKSFAALYHWASLLAINEIEAFRTRIEDDRPVVYDTIHTSTTISRPDGTFGFSFTAFDEDYERFHDAAQTEAERVRNETGLKSPYSGIDIVYCTVLRGMRFTSVEHAHGLGNGGGIPFLAFGEAYEENGKILMPHDVRCHHALVDGQHVGEYYKRLEQHLNSLR